MTAAIALIMKTGVSSPKTAPAAAAKAGPATAPKLKPDVSEAISSVR